MKMTLYIPLLLSVLCGFSIIDAQNILLCVSSTVTLTCNSEENLWVELETVKIDEGCGSLPGCTPEQLIDMANTLRSNCNDRNTSRCSINRENIPGVDCAAEIDFQCVKGVATTERPVLTTSKRENDWHDDFSSWQWAIIWIIIAVVLVAGIILLIMLINKCCYKALNQEKPKFVETTPTQSNIGSTLNSRSVSMSTLNRPTPKREASQEEIDEVRAYFGTNRKNKDKNMKHYGVGLGSSADSRRSSGDGASGEPNGRLYPGDDSSSGIGSVTYDSRTKHALYDEADTCHDDYISYTIKKQAKSPLVNIQPYGTLQNAKKVDEDLYKKDAPTVDICEDRREEDFRIDINSWTLNKHGQQAPREEPTGASTVSVDVEAASSDIQLNPGALWMLRDRQRIQTIKGKRSGAGLPHDYRRLSSVMSAGSENLGFIPEYSTLPNPRKKGSNDGASSNKPLGRVYSVDSGVYNDNPGLSASSPDLLLDLSDLDVSLSSDQFSIRKPTPSRRFYETFSSPRSDDVPASLPYSLNSSFISTDAGFNSESWQTNSVNNNLSYSYPNISLSGINNTKVREKKPKRASTTRRDDNAKHLTSNPALNDPSTHFIHQMALPVRYGPDASSWDSNRSIPIGFREPNKKQRGNLRITHLTQIRLGETVRLQQLQKKKSRKRINPKGTVHYAMRSDMSLAS